MTGWQKVRGSQSTKPREFDTGSSPETIYQRKNIQRVTEFNESDGTTTELWEYDERTMTRQEFVTIFTERVDITLSEVMEAMCELDASMSGE